MKTGCSRDLPVKKWRWLQADGGVEVSAGDGAAVLATFFNATTRECG